MSAPEIAVVVATNGARPLRLRWLLNALEEQDLARERFEVLVGHDSADPAVHALLAGHPLARSGALRALELPPSGPAPKRNAAWRAARAPVVAFTDDDCRPPAGWVRAALEAAAAHPGAIVQGQTQPDPGELEILLRAPHARTQQIVPPHVMAQTCNIVYPRALLEAVGGFDDSYPDAAGEDVDLALRARATGAPYVAAPEVLTHHAVETGLLARLRQTWRWQHLALMVRRHPELRREMAAGGYVWKAGHLRAAGVLAAAAVASRAPLAAVALAAPYVAATGLRYGRTPRGLARWAAELPGRVLVDAVELTAMMRGSVRHRTLLL